MAIKQNNFFSYCPILYWEFKFLQIHLILILTEIVMHNKDLESWQFCISKSVKKTFQRTEKRWNEKNRVGSFSATNKRLGFNTQSNYELWPFLCYRFKLIGLYCSFWLCIIENQANYSFHRKNFNPLRMTQSGNNSSNYPSLIPSFGLTFSRFSTAGRAASMLPQWGLISSVHPVERGDVNSKNWY